MLIKPHKWLSLSENALGLTCKQNEREAITKPQSFAANSYQANVRCSVIASTKVQESIVGPLHLINMLLAGRLAMSAASNLASSLTLI